jgi:hypothetical protein
MELYRRADGVKTRWASFENPGAEKGRGGTTNKGAKGRPAESVAAGETKTLLDVKGSGLVTRIWLTINDRSPRMLRSLRIDMHWDGAEAPAVSAPVGDFFGCGLGRRTPFESALFSDPEGRSFNCFVPMPFRESARITITNESDDVLGSLFYDMDLLMDVPHGEDALYFHAHWRRERPNRLCEDFAVLPRVTGAGRFLGSNIGVITDPAYEGSWWGEGEVKAWIDGDGEFPTLCGTGTEDYIGSAWGQGAFANRTQGCLVADGQNGHWAFYRYHVDDPIYFSSDCRVAIQTMGGCQREKIVTLQKNGVPLWPVTAGIPLMDRPGPVDMSDESIPGGWVNFYRQDDWSATAYFYLDRPENGLPPLPAPAERAAGLLDSMGGDARADT